MQYYENTKFNFNWNQQNPLSTAAKRCVMRLGIVIFLLSSIFVTIISSQITYAQVAENGNNYQYFEHDATGLNFQYDKDWNLVEGTGDLFVAKIWAPGNTALISVHHQYRDSMMSSEEIAKLHIEELEIQGNDLKIDESKDILISETPAWQLTYSVSDNQGHRLTVSEVYISTKDSRYVFSYNVWSGFPDHLPIFNSMVETIQISPTENKKSSDDSSYVPNWVEYNVRWWNMELIDDRTFVSAMQFLVNQKVIIMPPASQDTDSAPPLNDETMNFLKHGLGTWAAGKIGDEGFFRAIEYLMYQETINVN